MTKHAKPVMHGRDHAADGPDPIPGLSDSSGNGGVFYPDFGAADAGTVTVATTGEALFAFDNLHSSGVTASSSALTVGSTGVYEIHAAGLGALTGPAEPTGFLVWLLVNGSPSGWASATHYTQAALPADVPSPPDINYGFVAPMVLLAQLSLTGGDALQLKARNNTSVDVLFTQWRLVVKRLA